MKKILTLIAILATLTSTFAQIGKLGDEDNDKGTKNTITLPVYHDTTMRKCLTPAEENFLTTVPTYDGLRAAVHEMLLASVVHVPQGGKYVPGESVHYWSIYQAWTGPHKVTVPVVAGPKGEKGDTGQQGLQGPQGPQGPPGQGTIVYNLTPWNMGSMQMLCPNGASIYQWQLAGWSQVIQQGQPISINIANSNSNANANGNTINLGSGNATGTTTAGSGSTAKAGNTTPKK